MGLPGLEVREDAYVLPLYELANIIEMNLSAGLKIHTGEVHFFFYDFGIKDDRNKDRNHSKKVWFHGHGIINFLMHLHRKRHRFIVPMATSAPQFKDVIDQDDAWDEKSKDYLRWDDINTHWMGDLSSRGEWICCDQLVSVLWDRLKGRPELRY